MGNKLSRHIKTGKLNTITVTLDAFHDTRSNTLRGAPVFDSGKFPVDIRIVHRPETLADVHGIMIDTGNHQDFMVLCDMTMGFQFF